jgi:hypothetical protein
MHFNYKDVFRAGRFGFSAKKIWVGFVGILVAAIIYSVFAYVAFVSSPEWNVKQVWQAYRYLPFPSGVSLSWWGWVIWTIGMVLAGFIKMMALTAIAKITFEQLRGDEFYEAKEALKFAFKNWKGVFLSPVTLAVVIGVILVIGFLLGLGGRIPYVGPILVGIFSIPIFAAALFLVYLMVVFSVSLFLAPAIVATTKSDTFDTLFEVFSVLNDQPWRLVVWESVLAAISSAGAFILGFFVKRALLLTNWTLGMWAGPRGWMDKIWMKALWYLPRSLPFPPFSWMANGFLPSMTYRVDYVQGNGAEAFSGWLIGLSLYLVIFFVAAYAMAIWASGNALIYTVLVKMKDDKNLLEKREEDEFEPEPIKEDTGEKGD